MALHHTPANAEYPAGHSPALGDLLSGLALAGGVAGALAHRERTGVATVVDVSLLNVGMWAMSPGIVASPLLGIDDLPRRPDRKVIANPLANSYRTSDGKFVWLVMLQSVRYWVPFCRGIGRPELVDDPRFATDALRAQNSAECVDVLDAIFAERTLDEWRPVLDSCAVWSSVQTPREVHDDPQVAANGYLPTLQSASGEEFRLVASPVQFDETPASPCRSPELGEHTEAVLLELGYDWDAITELKTSGSIT
jgi:crotonobetainyl-CoA:carnitine CoA-transferase CaiB-like acyl-CoA transferase